MALVACVVGSTWLAPGAGATPVTSATAEVQPTSPVASQEVLVGASKGSPVVAPTLVESPGRAKPGKAARLVLVAPDKAKVCAVSFRQRGRKGSAVGTRLHGPYVTVGWKTASDARGVWTARISCGTSKKRANSLGSVETPVATGKKGNSATLANGKIRFKSAAIPTTLGTVPRPSVDPSLFAPSEEVGKGSTSNPYACGGCTSWAWRNRTDLPERLGNGRYWGSSARAAGFPVDGTPEVGAIAVYQPGSYGAAPYYGHVAYVEQVSGDRVYISEASYNPQRADCGDNLISRRWTGISGVEFIHQKGFNPSPGSPGGGSVPPNLTGSGWQTAFQSSSSTLWTVGGDNKGEMGLGMAPGTSPSITGMAGGGWQTAFHSSSGTLWIVGKDNKGEMGLGLAPGTSPSIAGMTDGGWQTAFQSNGRTLWVIGKDNKGDMGLGMAPGTSPSITGMPGGGWQVAFQASDNTLWIVGKDNRGAMNLGMKPGTSPSITGLAGGGWEVAFQAPDGGLWVVGSDNKGALNLGVAPNTSPAISSFSAS